MKLDVKDAQWINMTRFLMSIYPKGDFYSAIESRYKENYQKQNSKEIDPNILKELINSKLKYEQDVHKSIELTPNVLNENKMPDIFVKITDEGKNQIWQYMEYLYKETPSEYLSYLFKWIETDQPSRIQFHTFLYKEIIPNIMIFCLLTNQLSFEQIAQNYIEIKHINFEEQDDLNSFLKNIKKYINQLLNFDIIIKENTIQKMKDENDEIKEINIETFKLSESGMFIFQYIYTTLLSNKNNEIDKKNISFLSNSTNFNIQIKKHTTNGILTALISFLIILIYNILSIPISIYFTFFSIFLFVGISILQEYIIEKEKK